MERKYNQRVLKLDPRFRCISQPDHFTPRERDSGAHQIGRRVSHRAGLEAIVKRKISFPQRGTLIVQSVAKLLYQQCCSGSKALIVSSSESRSKQLSYTHSRMPNDQGAPKSVFNDSFMNLIYSKNPLSLCCVW